MKIIFTSPSNSLWSKDVRKLASILDSTIVSFGDLARGEVSNNSFIGRKIKEALNGGELMRSDLASLLISHKVFDDPSRKILINYPINIIQAESLAKYSKVSEYGLSACVVVAASKESIRMKFESQFHCINPSHPQIETLEANPACEVCRQPLVHSYDFNNYTVANLIDSYFAHDGVLVGASRLSELLGVPVIPYTTPQEVANRIQG